MRQDTENFHNSLRQKASYQIEFRRNKFLQDRGIASSLGFPLKQRDGAATTYIAPTVRRKLLTRPSASRGTFQPEPVLEMQEYEHILSIINNMVVVMERSPQAFRKMPEEDLRQHFLVQLNGQYEAQATGETFNFEGKTDILIREKGKNIFIAECKFWDGKKALIGTLDQLVERYVAWRDTKTAILLFNRNKNFSAVLAQIPEAVKQHPNYRKQLPLSTVSETQFRYLFTRHDDPNREFIVTIMVFEVPT
jgi:hypothetical protein